MMKRLPSLRVLPGCPSALVLAAAGAICLPAVLACWGESGSATTWDGAVRDSAGIPIVENFGMPMWREGEGWEFTEVLRIGTVEGDPEYEFGNVTGIAVLSDRRIVVADALAHELRFFSPDGVYQSSVGRQGQGPGEFGGDQLWPFVGPGDTLLVIDRGNQQAHVITPDGTWLESFSTLPRDGHWFGLARDAQPPGRIVTVHAPLRQPDGSLADSSDVILERDLHGAILDTVAVLPTYMASIPPRVSLFFPNVVDVRICENGLAVGNNYEYRSFWYGSGGAVDRIVSLAREPLPLTEEERSVMMGRFEQLFREFNVPSERAEAVRSRIRFTDHYPQYANFACGPAGTFLVQRVRPLSQLNEQERSRIRVDLHRPTGGLEWDVFDREGRYLGVVEMPGTEWVATVSNPRFVEDQATGTWYMYSVWADELEVHYVISWRVDGPTPG